MHITMKRLMSVILTVAMLLVMCAGCGGSSNNASNTSAAGASSGDTDADVAGDPLNAKYAVIRPSEGTIEGTILRQKCVDTSSLVPYLDTGSVDKNIVKQYADGLVNFYGGDCSQIIPGVAESWDVSDDGLVYTFHIRDGVSFWSGKACDAYAVADCLNFYMSIPGPSETFASIKSVEATDVSTVVITLSEPWISIFYYLGPYNCPIINVEAAQTYGQTVAGLDCTGAYIVESYTIGEKIVMKANQNYWDTPAEIETLEFVIITDDNSAAIGMQSGDIDAYPMMTEAVCQTLKLSDNVGQWGYVSPTVDALWYNTASDSLVSEPVVREALSYMINRDDAGVAEYGNNVVAADSYISNLIEGYCGPMVRDYDPEYGLQLLSDAEIDPADITFTVIYSAQGSWGGAVENIASQLSKYGITVELGGYDFFTFISMFFSGEYDAAYFNIDAVSAESCATYSHMFGNSTFNAANLDTGMPKLYEEMDALISQASVTLDKDTRCELLAQVLQLCDENCLATPICSQVEVQGYNTRFVPVYSDEDGAANFYYWRLAE